MKKIKNLLFPIALMLAGIATVQCQMVDYVTFPSPSTFNIGYHGNNLWNPGINAGIEQTWSITQHTNKRQRSYTIEKFFNADVGFFRDYSRQTPFFTHVGMNRRRIRENKIHLQMGFSPVGIYRSFLPETWEYTVNGTVEKKFLPGRWYYAPVLSMGIGRFRNNQPGTGWFAEINITTLIPYNTYTMPLINVKAGYRIPLKTQIIPKAI
jgi:TM2 domain-containing membrane protein YozV